jgi:hypothetical protein
MTNTVQIEENNDPRDNDPEEDDIDNFRFTQTAPGRFNVQATITRSVSPQQLHAAGGIGAGSIGGFMSMLNNLTGTALRPQGQQQGQGEGLYPGHGQNQDQNQSQSAFQEARNQSPGPQFHTARFQYHSGARLFPRDANNPEPRIEPVDDITKSVQPWNHIVSYVLTAQQCRDWPYGSIGCAAWSFPSAAIPWRGCWSSIWK